MDSTVWVAILTGATAVTAGWVTSNGNARAARVQAEAAALGQRASERREARKAAYLEFMRLAHVTEELYFRLDDALYPPISEDSASQAAHLPKTRAGLRDAYEPLMHCVRVIALEGPAAVAEQAEAVKKAVFLANRSLYYLAYGDQDEQKARTRFEAAHRLYRQRVQEFTEAASKSMGSSQIAPFRPDVAGRTVITGGVWSR